MHNWELLLHFKVHGLGKNLFGDGFAVWYTKEHGELGPVLGNRDFFTGLGLFFDTYSNHNGEHSVSGGFIGGLHWTPSSLPPLGPVVESCLTREVGSFQGSKLG